MSSQNKESNNPILPLDKLPESWKDNDRLNVLYSPLRGKQVNSRDWDSKLDFWKPSIQVYCMHNKLYTFTLLQLQNGFIHNGRTPTCLQPILEELIKSGDIMPLKDFQQKRDATWTDWTTNVLIKKPLMWSFNKMKNSLVSPDTSNVEYVHVAAIQHDADELYRSIPDGLKNEVMELKEFAKSIGMEHVGNVRLMLQCLQNNRKVVLQEVKQKDTESVIILLKVFESDGSMQPIRDVDVEIYRLCVMERLLKRKIESLETNMQNLREEAKLNLKNGHKQLAKTVLRKRHTLQDWIEKRSIHLTNVEITRMKLEESTHNQEIYASMKSAIDKFKSQFKDLNEDNVADTMAELGGLMDTHNDIQSTLAQDVNPIDIDLEAELAALMAEEDEDDTTANNSSPKPNVDELTKKVEDIKLPDVPSPEPKVLSFPDVDNQEVPDHHAG